MKRFVATEEQQRFIENNVLGRKVTELTKLFNEEFNTDVSELQIKSFKNRHKLKSGLDCCFKKGSIPYNKGLKGVGGNSSTTFKKGHIPANYRPVGSERVNIDGYVEVKVADPNKWQLKHRVIWEKHNRKIPKGYVVIFSDNNKRNLDINNLLMVSRKQLAFLNKNGLIKENSDLTKTGVLIADLLIKIGESKKKGK